MSLRRNPIALIALCFFVTVSTFGHGLHHLPGANHFEADAHSCEQCRFHSETPASDADTDADDQETHDCPICRFLAQAQIQAEFCVELPRSDSFELKNDRQPLLFERALVSLHLARAPPASSLFIG